MECDGKKLKQPHIHIHQMSTCFLSLFEARKVLQLFSLRFMLSRKKTDSNNPLILIDFNNKLKTNHKLLDQDMSFRSTHRM